MKTPKGINIRPTPADYKIVATLCEKLGLNVTSMTRMAWRVLAEKEKVNR